MRFISLKTQLMPPIQQTKKPNSTHIEADECESTKQASPI